MFQSVEYDWFTLSDFAILIAPDVVVEKNDQPGHFVHKPTIPEPVIVSVHNFITPVLNKPHV